MFIGALLNKHVPKKVKKLISSLSDRLFHYEPFATIRYLYITHSSSGFSFYSRSTSLSTAARLRKITRSSSGACGALLSTSGKSNVLSGLVEVKPKAEAFQLAFSNISEPESVELDALDTSAMTPAPSPSPPTLDINSIEPIKVATCAGQLFRLSTSVDEPHVPMSAKTGPFKLKHTTKASTRKARLPVALPIPCPLMERPAPSPIVTEPAVKPSKRNSLQLSPSLDRQASHVFPKPVVSRTNHKSSASLDKPVDTVEPIQAFPSYSIYRRSEVQKAPPGITLAGSSLPSEQRLLLGNRYSIIDAEPVESQIIETSIDPVCLTATPVATETENDDGADPSGSEWLTKLSYSKKPSKSNRNEISSSTNPLSLQGKFEAFNPKPVVSPTPVRTLGASRCESPKALSSSRKGSLESAQKPFSYQQPYLEYFFSFDSVEQEPKGLGVPVCDKRYSPSSQGQTEDSSNQSTYQGHYSSCVSSPKRSLTPVDSYSHTQVQGSYILPQSPSPRALEFHHSYSTDGRKSIAADCVPYESRVLPRLNEPPYQKLYSPFSTGLNINLNTIYHEPLPSPSDPFAVPGSSRPLSRLPFFGHYGHAASMFVDVNYDEFGGHRKITAEKRSNSNYNVPSSPHTYELFQ